VPVPDLPVGLRPVEPGKGEQQKHQYAAQPMAQPGRPEARFGEEGGGESGQETEGQDHHDAIEAVPTQHRFDVEGLRKRQQGEEAGADHRQGKAPEAAQGAGKETGKGRQGESHGRILSLVPGAAVGRTSRRMVGGGLVETMTTSRKNALSYGKKRAPQGRKRRP